MQTQPTQTQPEFISPLWLAAGIVLAISLLAFVLLQLGYVSVAARPAPPASPDQIVLKTAKMAFGVDRFEVAAGVPLSLQLDNDDFVGHSFDVDALDIHVPVDVNSSVAAVIEGLPAGRYEFYCGVPGHREAGMVGELVVTSDE